ncbi:VOC family protein [Pectobacterium brasiliense]|uniref:VOC family protein n=1 Tax=Pectobacterium brasiliense TaxID=180957 RepID=UPI0015DE5438|nr:VOC family protein [Pectobacterium brasiliense]MBA0195221.1 VOC family protein [Pectobacterium brasiliense]MBN3092561.1 VOC family protein [Pectobacterium brasiliense]MBN3141791.1 VOC family protein [Pectobacterium brasiliense]MBW5898570.1 VOC family protein [Pectobacterium brasiliense]
MKLHHFGFLSLSLKDTVNDFILLGHKVISDVIRDSERGVDIVFLTSETNEMIEIVSPYIENSVVRGLVRKNKNNIYHIAYLVSGIEDNILSLQSKGFVLIDSPKPAIAFNGKNVAFLISSYVGMIELIEE